MFHQTVHGVTGWELREPVHHPASERLSCPFWSRDIIFTARGVRHETQMFASTREELLLPEELADERRADAAHKAFLEESRDYFVNPNQPTF